MSSIEKVFHSKKVFIGFLVCDKGVEAYAEALVEGGVDLLEIGLPFSDPVADGPVIQEAAHRALKNGITPDEVLDSISAIKKRVSVPIILFSYFNPLYKKGRSFLKKMREKGCDGVLIVDLPLEEAGEFMQGVREEGLDMIFIASASSPLDRIKHISDASSGFLYYACQKGTTGKREALPEQIHERIHRIKEHTSLPVAVGFGVSSQQQAADLLKVADGFIVGSAFVERTSAGCSPQQLTELARSIDPRSSS